MEHYKELGIVLRTFLEEFRKKSDAQVSVQDGLAIIGAVPNCAIIRSHDTDADRIILSFHFDCHPLSVVNLLKLAIEELGVDNLSFSDCFLTDVNGAVTYESETGFELMNIQYLRDVLAQNEESAVVFVS